MTKSAVPLVKAQKTSFPGGFTVLMAVYGNDDITLFKRAVQSVYSNTLLPDSFVLVVDGPVPEPLQTTIQSLRELYMLKVLQLPVNMGLASALNVGLNNIATEWVARADADDFNVPDRFALQAAVIEQACARLDIVGGAIQEIDLSGKEIAVRRTVEEHSEILRYAASRNPFNHMTVVYRTALALRCGGYPTDIYLKEDYALWAQMLASGARSHNLPDILVFATAGRDMYRRRGGKRYALAEIALQRHLMHIGLKSSVMACIQGLVRASIFLLPVIVRGWIYEVALRRHSKDMP